jgi:glycosyltransferase involved in cell wall biosynthesis
MRVLSLFHTLTYPPESGVTKRNYHLLEELARRHETTVVALGAPEDAERIRSRLGDRLRSLTFVDGRRPRWMNLLRRIELVLLRGSLLQHSYTPELQRAIDEAFRAERFDLVFLSAPVFAFYRRPPDVPCITDAHNVEYDMCHRAYEQGKGLLRRAYLYDQYRLLKREELQACGAGEALLTTSERDKQVFRRDLRDQAIDVVPNGVDLEYFTPGAGEQVPGSIVFCGLMNYAPNDQGMTWFLDRVFPLVRREVAGARVTVVGSGPSRALLSRASDAVTVTGYVKDVRPHVAAGQVYVVPLLVGGGTRLKALEAMAMGKAIVTTSVGCEGIDLEHEESALFADSPEELARAVIRLFRDPALRTRLAEKARAIAIEKYGWRAIGDKLDVVCRSVAERGRVARGAPVTPTRVVV